PGLRVLAYDHAEHNNYQYVVVDVDESLTGLSRDEIVEILWAENVIARRYFYPGCHRQAPYNRAQTGQRLPVTEAVSERVLLLPTGTALEEEHVVAVCEVIRAAIAYGPEIRARISTVANTCQSGPNSNA